MNIFFTFIFQESVGQIAEFADVGLSVRGTHYPSGREPKNGDRRLHLLIEARSEHALRRAKDEIIRIMKDSLRQLVYIFLLSN